MRILVKVIVLILVCAAAGVAAEVCPPGAIPATVGSGPAEPVQMAGNDTFDYCFARSLGITCQQVATYRGLGFTNSDMAINAAIAKKVNRTFGTVAAQYQLTPDWATVSAYYKTSCGELGLIPELMNKDDNVFNSAFISQMYGLPVADLNSLKNQGFSWGEINMIANASVRTLQTLQQIASLRKDGTTWESMATRFSIPLSRLTEPCPMSPSRASSCATCGAGPVCTKPVSPVMFDKAGNVFITQDEALRFYSMGNDWMNVAIAVNIARETGWPIWQVLSDLRSGLTWDQVALNYSVPASTAFNLSCYPFPQTSIFSESMQQKNMEKIIKFQAATSVAGPSSIVLPGVPNNRNNPIY